ncbi:MAG: dTDP-4-dehydrorhamnose reductase [Sulfuricellaceae bacterium]|nr:dTDP-4-dehydrorhamnose reductase [Sulfuricellaceae bacterium]
MKILITGKDGQVGWELQRTLSTLGEVIAHDRHGLDLANPDSIRQAIRSAKPDLIINAAAYTAVDKAESEPELAMAINGIAPGIMAEEAKKMGAALIHYSTDYVFDGTKPAPYVEQDVTNPLNVYGKTKLAGEDAVKAAGCPFLILRTSWVYGGRGKNFLLTMLRLAGERDKLSIVADQTGAPTWSRMIAEATAQIVAQRKSGLSDLHGLFHLSATGSTSWHGFTEAILSNRNVSEVSARPQLLPISTAEYPLPAARPMNSRLSCGSLQQAFGLELPAWDVSLRLCMADL